MTTATCIHLLEKTYSGDNLKVDRENKVIRGVKVCGRESKNGYEYSQAALESLVRMYEGVSVLLDHPDRSNARAERSFLDSFGILENPRLGTDGVYADLHYLESHPSAGLILERAERFPRSFGLSHNADGNQVRSGGKWVIESIREVRSVDIVLRPATTEGLFESVDPETGYDPNSLQSLMQPFREGSERLKAFIDESAAISGGETKRRMKQVDDALARFLAELTAAVQGDTAGVMESYLGYRPDDCKPLPKTTREYADVLDPGYTPLSRTVNEQAEPDDSGRTTSPMTTKEYAKLL